MTMREVVRLVVSRLEAAGSDYVIVGALAYNVHGIPRSTQDADFVVAMDAPALDALLTALPPEFELDSQARMELFTATMRWVVEIRDTELKVEFFLRGNDPHHLEEFTRRLRRTLPGIGVEAWIATAEDLIIQKLRWARNKDLDDARNILAVQDRTLDSAYLEFWCDRHGTRPRLEELRRSIPPGL